MMPTLLIYGAADYTERLASLHAERFGLDFIIAGRTIERNPHGGIRIATQCCTSSTGCRESRGHRCCVWRGFGSAELCRPIHEHGEAPD